MAAMTLTARRATDARCRAPVAVLAFVVGLAVATLRTQPALGAPAAGFPPCLSTQGACLPHLEGTKDLFCPGQSGYCCYKIPSLLRIPPHGRIGSSGRTAGPGGVLLAFIEARKFSCDDHGYIDLRVRRSTDNGATWSASALAAASNSTAADYVTVGDAMPVYDNVTGRVFLFFARNNHDLFMQHSDDGGLSWTPRANVTAPLKRPLQSGWIGSGHANAIQLASGRLAAPVYTNQSYLLLSDDHGATWRPGGGVPAVPGSEWDAAPLGVGGKALLANIRSKGDLFTGDMHRWLAVSEDAGETWGAAAQNADLPSPVGGCEGATVLHPNGALYFSGPAKGPLRNVMTVKKSVDGGRSWAAHTTLWSEAAGYSSMVIMDPADTQSDIGILYGRNNQTLMIIFEAQAISFTTFAP